MSIKKINVITLVTIAFFSAVIISCKKTTTATTKIAFTNAEMKPWFDTYCASCHSNGRSNSSQWLYDASDYDKSIKSEIGELYKEVYTNKSMPIGVSLTASELTKFKSWYDAGYKSN